MPKLADSLNNQLGDLRSQITREVTRLIVLISQLPQMMPADEVKDLVESFLGKLF